MISQSINYVCATWSTCFASILICSQQFRLWVHGIGDVNGSYEHFFSCLYTNVHLVLHGSVNCVGDLNDTIRQLKLVAQFKFSWQIGLLSGDLSKIQSWYSTSICRSKLASQSFATLWLKMFRLFGSFFWFYADLLGLDSNCHRSLQIPGLHIWQYLASILTVVGLCTFLVRAKKLQSRLVWHIFTFTYIVGL